MVVFPFYNESSQLIRVANKHKVLCRFNYDDALKKRYHFITSTANCVDPHVVMGNETGPNSANASIAEQLKSRSKKFSPCLNEQMQYKFVEMF
jgi:hypothetical protein